MIPLLFLHMFFACVGAMCFPTSVSADDVRNARFLSDPIVSMNSSLE